MKILSVKEKQFMKRQVPEELEGLFIISFTGIFLLKEKLNYKGNKYSIQKMLMKRKLIVFKEDSL
jgi:hypothetical protein